MARRRALWTLLLAATLAIAGCDQADSGATAAPTGAVGAATTPAPSPGAASPEAGSGATPTSTSPGTLPGPTASGTTGSGGTGGATSGVTGVSIPDLVDRVQPSVVAILRQDGGEGSGVIWSADGVIVTNNHVVEGLNEVIVVYADGQRDTATVGATDPRSDLAVLRVDRSGLPAATFREDLPRVGELAIAIGNPLGFEETVTAGIISGLGRSIPGSATRAPALIDLVQTDAPISPGNSGGALVGEDGRIIGVNVAYIPPAGGAVSIGFAIPARTAVDVVEQLLETGTVEHAYMGIRPRTLDLPTARAYDLPVEAGAVLLDLVRGGPAAEAGLEPGDIVVALDGEPVESAEDLLTLLRRHRPGDAVEVTYVRDDATEQTATVTLGDLPVSGAPR